VAQHAVLLRRRAGQSVAGILGVVLLLPFPFPTPCYSGSIQIGLDQAIAPSRWSTRA